MDLVHCIYCSASSKPVFSKEDLGALLEQCRRFNGANDITGMLLYQGRSFFQVLEGDREVIESLYRKISADKRHVRVTKLILEGIEKRDFGMWTMGYSNVASEELAKIPGLNDFFVRGLSYMELGEGRAKTLLAAFKEGRWRASLT